MRKNILVFLIPLVILIAMLSILNPQNTFAQTSGPEVIQLSATGQGRALAVAYSPTGEILAIGTSIGIYYYDSTTLELIRFVPTETWVRAIAFSPDGRWLASGSYDATVRLWNVRDGTLGKELKGHTAWVRGLAFSPDGELLATASDDNTVRIWRVTDGKTVRVIKDGVEGVKAVAFSPDGDLLATGGFDKSIRLWNVGEGSLVRELKGHRDWIRALTFSPDGEYLASGAFDATLRLWRVLDGEMLATREEHSSSVLGVAFSPDGKLLASASVDETVRLWAMPDAKPYALLKGHQDFVFSVAFSPDGKKLASGAVDNTVRIWEVPQAASSSAQETVTAPSDCRACHHPQSRQEPPRVIEAECAVCHLNGALGLNWCPAFSRTSGTTTMSVNSAGIYSQSGVPHDNRVFGIEISSPGNGEHLYSLGDIVSAVPVKGKIYSTGNNLKDIPIQLQIQSEGFLTTTLETFPGTDGNFVFNINISNTDSELDLIRTTRTQAPNENSCWRCHDKYSVASTKLPAGQYRLVVTAILADGSKVSDDRWVIVDHGHYIAVQIKTEMEGESRIVPNIPVTASTRLYEWRGRIFSVDTDQNGNGIINIETVSYEPVNYQFQVNPVVVDGVLYESVEPIEVNLPAGATSAPPVTIKVRGQLGQIQGHISGANKPLKIWAIQTPSGSTQSVITADDGTFAFSDLRIGKYLLTADPQSLAEQKLTMKAEAIDLAQTPTAEIELKAAMAEGSEVRGIVKDETGTFLPFAWVRGDAQAQAVDPKTSEYTIMGLPKGKNTVIASAPGYYSQAGVVDADKFDFVLIRRPETKLFPWGSGNISLPPETIAKVEGTNISFEQGWLWGKGGEAAPLTIRVSGVQITIPSGSFALERIPTQDAWFYLLGGTAQLEMAAEKPLIEMKSGQMVRISATEPLQVVDYNPVVVQALHAGQTSPTSPVWQPSLSAQVRYRLAMVGISTAQAITFATYVLIILLLFGLIIGGLVWAVKHWWFKPKV